MPLLSVIGGGSEYAYRGNYDNWPDQFSFTNQSNVIPGTLVTTQITITGINYKSIVTGTNSILISINGGAFISSPQTIRNGQTITLQYQTTSGSDNDFNKSYTTTISVGKRTASWTVSTKVKDNNPNAFTFDTINQTEISTITQSNTITLSGLESGYTTYTFISSGSGTFSVNGSLTYVTSAYVNNNDTIRMKQTSSSVYDTPVITEITVGEYTTQFTVRTRLADSTINPITFSSITNANINVEQLSNTVTLSGVDVGILLSANISTNAGISINSSPSYVFGPVGVNNGDTIRIRIPGTSLTEYSKTTIATLNVSGVIGTFSVTTRPVPIKTIPNSFSFTAITNAELLTVIESNIITLSGMTTGDSGAATISGTSAEFKVTRNGSVVKNYSSSSFQVLNGDQIQLRITSGGELANVQATFTVNGTDTFTNISGTPGSTNANWLVTSKSLTCTAANFSSSLVNVTTNQVGELRSTSFVVSGLNVNCDNIVTVSDGNSYVRVNGSQGTTLNVSNGDTVEVYMTSPSAGTTRTTVITVRRPSGANAVSANWSITTTTLPVVNITLSPSSIFIGDASTLSWSVDYGTSIVSSTFGTTALSGSISVNPTVSTTFSITAIGPGGQSSGSATLTVSIRPPVITLTANPTSVAYNGSTTLTWNSTGANSVSSSNFGASSTSGSTTLYNLISSQTYQITVSGPGGSTSASVQVSVGACIPETTSTSFANFKYGKITYNNGSTDPYGFQSLTPFFTSSTSASYNILLTPSYSYGQVQDLISSYYLSINGRPVELNGLNYWIGDFKGNNRTPATLQNAILVAYNESEKLVVDAAGGRKSILDSCNKTW